jgi:hypothetical protein
VNIFSKIKWVSEVIPVCKFTSSLKCDILHQINLFIGYCTLVNGTGEDAFVLLHDLSDNPENANIVPSC